MTVRARSSSSRQEEGFALVVTIALMAFLVVLLITVGAFTRVETRVADNTQKESVAREHAKKALQHAVAELQRHAGRDDRVTFRAEALADAEPLVQNNPFWTGVLDTTGPDLASTRWLVSGNEHFENLGAPEYLFPIFQPENFFPDTPGPGVQVAGPVASDIRLVGPGSVAFHEHEVRVPRMPIRVSRHRGLAVSAVQKNQDQLPRGGHVIGHYAYWVGDEGVKASLGRAGDRYPYEEYLSRDDPTWSQGFRTALNNWNNPFVPTLFQDDFARAVTPTRFGYEFLNGFFPALVSPGQSPLTPFQDVNHVFPDFFPNPNERLYNGRLSTWWSLMSRGQAGEEFIINSDWNDFPTGFVKGESTVDSGEEEFERLFHDTTAFSRGVLANTSDSGLKVDLRRSTDNNDWRGSDHRNWAGVRAFSSFDSTREGAPVQIGDEPLYPLGIAGADSEWAKPVVTHVHVNATVVGPNGRGGGVTVLLEPKIGIWNPYDVDLDFSDIDIELQLEGGLQVAAGVHWIEMDGEEDPPTEENHYGSWTGEQIDLGEYFRAVNASQLRAGETALYSLDGSGVFVRGRDNGGVIEIDAGTFDVAAIDDERFEEIISAIPTVYVPGQALVVRMALDDNEIFGRQIDTDSIDGLNVAAAYGQDQGAWQSDWAPIDAQSYGVSNFHEGPQLSFAFGADVQEQILPSSLGGQLSDLRGLSYRQRGDSDFYARVLPSVRAWNNLNNGYPVIVFEGGSADDQFDYPFDLEAARYMVFYHILRDFSDQTQITGFSADWTNNWSPLTSVGQLRTRVRRPSADLFDRAFFSGSLLPTPGQDVEPLFHNARIVPYYGEHGFTDSTFDPNNNVRDRLADPDEAAAHLMVDGAFNVNSTSVKAWAALLNSFANHDLLIFLPQTQDGSGLVYRHNREFFNARQSFLDSYFSSFTTAPGASYFGRVADSANPRSIWTNGLRELKPLNLAFPMQQQPDFNYEFRAVLPQGESVWHDTAAAAMAEIIVNRIKNHYASNGRPFRSMQEFIESDILQLAINNVQWRWDGTEGQGQGLNWYYDGGSWGEIPRAAPSYLHQDDLFAVLGSVLSARSDTFVIRAYGDAYNPVTNEIEARAWLEAIVQRVPTPVNPDNNGIGVEPQNPDADPHGRKFEIVSFRWLDPTEI